MVEALKDKEKGFFIKNPDYMFNWLSLLLIIINLQFNTYKKVLHIDFKTKLLGIEQEVLNELKLLLIPS